MNTHKKEALDRCAPSLYYEIITRREGNYSEAAYYLLKNRLGSALKKVYDAYGFGLIDEFDDTIDDFFLYLYEEDPTAAHPPFSILQSIRNKDAFFRWVLSTYRIFLLNKSKEMEREKYILAKAMIHNREEEKPLTDELMILYLANAIAFADQQFTAMKRFIFYRMLLSVLDHRLAIPQEEMAKALCLHTVTYRVYTKRQKDRFLRFVTVQELGGSLSLDLQHEAMRDDILAGFSQLYKVLMIYYLRALQELPHALAVSKLRKQYMSEQDRLMHEATPSYGFSNTKEVRSFYRSIKAYLKRLWDWG